MQLLQNRDTQMGKEQVWETTVGQEGEARQKHSSPFPADLELNRKGCSRSPTPAEGGGFATQSSTMWPLSEGPSGGQGEAVIHWLFGSLSMQI